ncbi:MAG: tRNA dihydrouridine synthase DusB [Moraxellaceae bacterium]|jgi:tRNA-dihydrouridine synthase B|nr:tRNA dihydrouridine synthase DusB [Moraxellaceae bacterium]MBP9046305.1 tRNA dihydrouridine synthase DusB [Moraxellaceae bacterium]MBP9731067.1 tRNA dihydrouridine synthase DusB [Moraxellaceae bacterium]HQV41202.1 tRNA dihydrouridine synthase DusB [Moraxellaceae bacterium]HQX89535.1 tRNA dihydrouridine synthase DusB [Moraxellaceae bacterium]
MLKPVNIGPYTLDTPIALAPMAGVTDGPFRQMCRRWGAGYVVSEMVASDTRLWKSRKSSTRLDYTGEASPRAIQIVGYDADMMADAARACVDLGAQIIDINMGCPAKKVCNRLAGSALMQDEKLVAEILSTVVNAVSVPVTLKTRTGWNHDNRNGVQIARIAEDCGIQLLVMHGRTRADKYMGAAEYNTIRAVKQSVNIPVFANGDIDSAEKAEMVLVQTGCDGIMVGRGAHGRPWIFREINHFLRTQEHLPPPSSDEVRETVLGHLEDLYAFYGEFQGLRFARKHMSWYSEYLPDGAATSHFFNKLESSVQQLAFARDYFGRLANGEVRAA